MSKNTGALIGAGVGGIGGLFMGNPLLGASLGSSIGGMFDGGGGDDNELEDIRTKEQKAAAAALQQLAMSGSFDGINLGEGYGGTLGAYDTSGQETAYNQLMSLYGGGALGTAQDTMTKLTNLEFNPDDPSSGYAAFSRQLARAGEESSDVLNREAAITGSRFGTAIAGEKADLAAQMQDQSGSFLAQLYNQQQNRALQAAQGLTGLAGQQANIAMSASQQAAMVNAIKDQQAKDAYSEYKRQRAEELSRIDLLQTESNRNPYLGVSSLPGSPSPFSTLANSVLSSLGQDIGGNLSGSLSGLFNMFGKKTTTPTASDYSFGSAQAGINTSAWRS